MTTEEKQASNEVLSGIKVPEVEKKETPDAYKGSSVLIFGDTHFDDVFNGQHVDYIANTHRVMLQILNITQEENPDVVILAGDLIGVSSGRSKIKSRQYLKEVTQFLIALSDNGRRKLSVVKGNHDFNVESDYSFLSGINIFHEPTDTDNVIYLSPDDRPDNQMFIHLRNYNRENLPIIDHDRDTQEYLQAKKGGVNVVVAHNDFYIEGKEESYITDEAIELSTHSAFYGADLIFTGHIHLPSLSTQTFIDGNGDEVAHLNLGCPTRPSAQETYNKVWYVKLAYSTEEESWDYIPKSMELLDYRDEFVDSENLIKQLSSLGNGKEDAESNKRLEEVLGLLSEDKIYTQDVLEQIDMLTIATEEERNLAKKYIDYARSMI